MHLALTTLLVCVLAGSVLCFVVIGWAQRARRNALSRTAHAARMHFSPEDPFDIVRRYADFDLVVGGHGARANNVTYGRVEGCPVRAFDFRIEVGHGTRRQTRRYSVLAIETQFELPDVLMWTFAEWESSPLSAHRCDRHVRSWSYRGGDELACRLADARGDIHHQGAGMQTCGSILLAWMPAPWRGGAEYAVGPDDAPPLLRSMLAFDKSGAPRQGDQASRPGGDGRIT